MKSNIVPIENPLFTEHEYQTLSRFIIYEKLVVVPKINNLIRQKKNTWIVFTL